jgi:hypothetical protein
MAAVVLYILSADPEPNLIAHVRLAQSFADPYQLSVVVVMSVGVGPWLPHMSHDPLNVFPNAVPNLFFLRQSASLKKYLCTKLKL